MIWLWIASREAMTLAGQQSALSFELRAGLELARFGLIGVKSEGPMI